MTVCQTIKDKAIATFLFCVFLCFQTWDQNKISNYLQNVFLSNTDTVLCSVCYDLHLFIMSF